MRDRARGDNLKGKEKGIRGMGRQCIELKIENCRIENCRIGIEERRIT